MPRSILLIGNIVLFAASLAGSLPIPLWEAVQQAENLLQRLHGVRIESWHLLGVIASILAVIVPGLTCIHFMSIRKVNVTRAAGLLRVGIIANFVFVMMFFALVVIYNRFDIGFGRERVWINFGAVTALVFVATLVINVLALSKSRIRVTDPRPPEAPN